MQLHMNSYIILILSCEQFFKMAVLRMRKHWNFDRILVKNTKKFGPMERWRVLIPISPLATSLSWELWQHSSINLPSTESMYNDAIFISADVWWSHDRPGHVIRTGEGWGESRGRGLCWGWVASCGLSLLLRSFFGSLYFLWRWFQCPILKFDVLCW